MPAGPEDSQNAPAPPRADSATARPQQECTPGREAYSPLLLTRELKDDGRALIVYRRAIGDDRPGPA